MSDHDRSIAPDGLYDTDEVAFLLGFRGKSKKGNRNRVYEIKPERLARVHIGAKGGRTMFLGRDILRYIDSCRTEKSA